MHTSRTLVPAGSKDVLLKLMNLWDPAVWLHKDAMVVELQPMDVLERATLPKKKQQQECIHKLICGTDYRL